jgi:hypothetical protein
MPKQCPAGPHRHLARHTNSRRVAHVGRHREPRVAAACSTARGGVRWGGGGASETSGVPRAGDEVEG